MQALGTYYKNSYFHWLKNVLKSYICIWKVFISVVGVQFVSDVIPYLCYDINVMMLF